MRDEPIKTRTGELWSWTWGAWISPAFPYLEERPWTPVAIAGRLCFVASDTAALNDLVDPRACDEARWCVVWGEDRGPWFDEVSSLGEYHDRPIYLAHERSGGQRLYAVVWGDRKSQPFDHQIGFEVGLGGITIRAFDPHLGLTGPAVRADWQSI